MTIMPSCQVYVEKMRTLVSAGVDFVLVRSTALTFLWCVRLVGPQPVVQSNTGHQTTTQCSYNFSPLSPLQQILSSLNHPSNRSLHFPVLIGLCCRAFPVAVILVFRTDTISTPDSPCLLKVPLPARFQTELRLCHTVCGCDS